MDYFTKDTVSLLDYFDNNDSLVFLDEPARTLEGAEAVNTEFEESMKGRLEKGYILPGQMGAVTHYKKLFAKLGAKRLIMLSTMEYKFGEIKAAASASIDARAVSSYNGDFSMLSSELKTMKKKGYRVVLLTSSASRASRLAEDLRDEDITAFVPQDRDRVIQPGEVMVASGSLSRGFEYPLIKFAMICETDIFGRQKKARKKQNTAD